MKIKRFNESRDYSFGDSMEFLPIDINLPQEVQDYIKDYCEVSEIMYEIYPKELIEKNLIMSTWCEFDLNDDNIELKTFNLYKNIQFSVFCQGVTFYNKSEDGSPGYMVYKYLGDNSVILIEV